MKTLIGLLVLVTSVATFANDKNAYADMAVQCFDEASVQVLIGISQAEHQMELDRIVALLMANFQMCENTEKDMLDCEIQSVEVAIKTLVDSFDAQDIVSDLKVCELID